MTTIIPSNIHLHQRTGILDLTWDEKTYSLTAEYLRVHSPSAEVQGHSPDQAVLQTGKRDVRIKTLEPQGHYAVRIEFSDGHDSGIFTWEYLHELAIQHDILWQRYLDALSRQGASREPRFIAIGH
ncbi:MAG: DUF971 domain-containing protein [Pseudomonadota bacterium]